VPVDPRLQPVLAVLAHEMTVATTSTASGHTRLSTIEHRATPTSTRDAASSAPLLCRRRFTCETARPASVGAVGHGRLADSYEELGAAR
jgi:hypothetical protein